MAKKAVKENRPKITITALVFGIASLVLFWIPVIDILLSLTAIILGIIGVVKANKVSSLEGRGYAIAGIVLGAISIFLSLIITAIGMLAYFGVLSPSNIAP